MPHEILIVLFIDWTLFKFRHVRMVGYETGKANNSKSLYVYDDYIYSAFHSLDLFQL